MNIYAGTNHFGTVYCVGKKPWCRTMHSCICLVRDVVHICPVFVLFLVKDKVCTYICAMCRAARRIKCCWLRKWNAAGSAVQQKKKRDTLPAQFQLVKNVKRGKKKIFYNLYLQGTRQPKIAMAWKRRQHGCTARRLYFRPRLTSNDVGASLIHSCWNLENKYRLYT